MNQKSSQRMGLALRCVLSPSCEPSFLLLPYGGGVFLVAKRPGPTTAYPNSLRQNTNLAALIIPIHCPFVKSSIKDVARAEAKRV